MSFPRRAAVTAAVLSLMIATDPAQVLAATANTAQQQQKQKEIKGQLSQLQYELSEVSDDESELLKKLDEINNRKAGVVAQIDDLQNQMAQAQRDMDAANARLAVVQQQLDEAQAKLKAAQDALAESNRKLNEQAVDAYMGVQNDSNMASFMLRAEDMRDATAASQYLNQIVQDRQAILEQNRELEGQANDAKLQVQQVMDQAKSDRDTVATRQKQLDGQKGELDQLRSQVQAEVDAQNVLVAQIEEKRISIQTQMDALQAQSDSIAAMLRALSAPNAGPVIAGKGVLMLPVPGARLSSPFGMRLDPVLNRYQLHAGQDLAVPTGTPIRAAASGTVVSTIPVSSSGGYGNYTCINHGGGLATCYAHQSKFMVTAGQYVNKGDIIGLSGSTGFSTGPHLHFEVRVNGNPVNPLGYL